MNLNVYSYARGYHDAVAHNGYNLSSFSNKIHFVQAYSCGYAMGELDFGYDLSGYLSPSNEASILKSLPIDLYSTEFIIKLSNAFNIPLRVKFRGPRPKSGNRTNLSRKGTCLKKDAQTFTVYPRDFKDNFKYPNNKFLER